MFLVVPSGHLEVTTCQRRDPVLVG
ncbi:uncharacterized protein METZ01_LOCUS21457 [marine metagenome]|uniref:Uncharacterized protein n=1 Tax=marine metagenome TaxID=408172 RepID=A0A381PT08_9ZZZZ